MINSISKAFPTAQIISTAEPEAGSSAEMLIVQLEIRNGERQTIVARRHKQIEKEQRLLSWLQLAGVKTSKPLFWDQENRVLLLEFVEGENRYDANPSRKIGRQIGEQLVSIHSVSIPKSEQAIFRNEPTKLPENKNAPTEDKIREALELNWPIQTSTDPVFIHGDFWPGNMLWQNDQLAGVIDWEDAKLGNRYQDLAISRFDCCFIFGRETMQVMTETYAQSFALNRRELALWDLYSALRAAHGIPDWAVGYDELGRPDLTEKAIWESHRWFLDQALNLLNSNGESE